MKKDMKKKTGLILGGFLLLSLVLVVGIVMAATEQTSSATVTVSTFLSITIGTCSGGLGFGTNINPGTDNNPITCQTNVIPAATVTNDAVSNVDITVKVKGSDFGAGVIPVSNVKFDEDNAQSNLTTLTTTYQTSTSNVAPGTDAKIWYWLDIPDGTAAGTHTSTFSFEGS